MAGNVKYEMATALPEFDDYYGLLMGAFYTIPFAIFGLASAFLTQSK